MLVAYQVSLQLVSSLRQVVPVLERSDRDLADQMRRAANSIVLNIAEGQRSAKGNKHKHYAIAHGSANEVRAALELAVAWGWIGDTDQSCAIVDHLLALLWGLTHARAPRTPTEA